MFNLQNFLSNLTAQCQALSLPISFLDTEKTMAFDLVNSCSIDIIKMISMPHVRRLKIHFGGATKSGAIFSITADFNQFACGLDSFHDVSFLDITEITQSDLTDVQNFSKAFKNALKAIPEDEISFLCHNEYDINDEAYELLFANNEEVV